MILKTFLSQYISEEHVEDIIFHSGSIIFKDTIKTMLALGILYGIYFFLNPYIHWPMLKWVFGGIGIILLIKYIIDIYNKYIDCIVLSKNGITFFARDGLWKYKTEFFGWDTIETISHEQDSFRDKIFFKGDIKIQLNQTTMYSFENVNTPKRHVKKILQLKEQYLSKKEKEIPSKQEIDHDQLGILSEALSDVIKEYLEKKSQ